MLGCRRILAPTTRFYSSARSWRNRECLVNVQGAASTTFRTGHMARFADGAVVASTGETAVLCTVVSDLPSNNGDGGVPLIVDFKQSASAIGRIPTNYLRREMQQSDADIIASRIIDRSLRPLFPTRFNMPVQITCKPLSVTEDGDPVILGLNAASAALSISNIPWLGPVAAVRIGLLGDKIVVNPARSMMKESKLDLLVAGADEKNVVMIEMDGEQIAEDTILECLDTAFHNISELRIGILKLRSEVGKEKSTLASSEIDESLEKQIATLAEARLYYIFTDSEHDKMSRDNAVKELLEDVFREIEKSPQKYHYGYWNQMRWPWFDGVPTHKFRSQPVQ
uniref:polyribonucleotide nucleotidyltransferase n=1 Tax=Steinernema glaseri TaxID=37863 RepID=A0A1I7Y2K1_9BILA